MAEDLCYITAAGFAAKLRSRELTSTELVGALIDRYDAVGESVNCYAAFLGERALKQAEHLDGLLDVGVDLGPLHGVPIALKDNIDLAGVPSTCGSRLWRDRVPTTNSDIANALHAAGGIVIGKANMYEWAYGSPSSLFGDVANPWDRKLTAGASSSGSAAAIAAGLATVAIGTDLGGSIRIPAAMCGVFGLKPTFGLVSRKGVFPMGQTLDHAGPISRSAEDSWTVLEVLSTARRSDRNAYAEQRVLGPSTPGSMGLNGFRVGVARPQTGHGVSVEVDEAMQELIRVPRLGDLPVLRPP